MEDLTDRLFSFILSGLKGYSTTVGKGRDIPGNIKVHIKYKSVYKSA